MSEELIAQRKVIVFSTVGKNGIELETLAQTWAQLQDVLTQNQVSFDKMKVVIGENKHTLESPNATLPEGDFTLFLMPKKTKSGHEFSNLPYKECREKIKSYIDNAPKAEKDDVKKFFSSSDGRNYTQTSTEEMRDNINKWVKKHGASTTSKAEPEEKKEVKKEEKKTEAKKVQSSEDGLFSGIVNEINKVDKSNLSNSEVSELNNILELTLGLEKKIQVRIDAERAAGQASERAKKEREEKNKKLADMANDLRKEFPDIQ